MCFKIITKSLQEDDVCMNDCLTVEYMIPTCRFRASNRFAGMLQRDSGAFQIFSAGVSR